MVPPFVRCEDSRGGTEEIVVTWTLPMLDTWREAEEVEVDVEEEEDGWFLVCTGAALFMGFDAVVLGVEEECVLLEEEEEEERGEIVDTAREAVAEEEVGGVSVVMELIGYDTTSFCLDAAPPAPLTPPLLPPPAPLSTGLAKETMELSRDAVFVILAAEPPPEEELLLVCLA